MMTAFSNKLSVSEPSPEYQGKDSRLNWNLNAQLTKYRTEEHHEERNGYKQSLSLYPLFLKP